MIESVQFKNFRVLRDATLPLAQFTLIVGPNGSGKTTALQGLTLLAQGGPAYQGLTPAAGATGDVEIVAQWDSEQDHASTRLHRGPSGKAERTHAVPHSGRVPADLATQLSNKLSELRCFSLDPQAIQTPVALQPNMVLSPNGANLAGVLDGLRDKHPERFDLLNRELASWLPEYDRLLFETLIQGRRAFALRTREGQHVMRASVLSQGTLLALAILTLAYLPDPPTIVCLEEPDRGIHPRLLREVQDALYRLAYPESFGESRPPVQVIATTHSPYMVDLFKDHPEEIVIAQKVGLEAKFERLSDRTDLADILRDAHLGDLWYSGILGGVPINS